MFFIHFNWTFELISYECENVSCRLRLSIFHCILHMDWVSPLGAHLDLECSLESTRKELFPQIAVLLWRITK